MLSAVTREYQDAQKVAAVNPDAHAVSLGDVLEAIRVGQNASGKDLHERLKNPAGRGVIPDALAQAAQGPCC